MSAHPSIAWDNPSRRVFTARVADVTQVFVQEGSDPPRRLTNEDVGGLMPCITPDGDEVIWWRSAARGSAWGSWRKQGFGGPLGDSHPIAHNLPDVYQSDGPVLFGAGSIFVLAHLPPSLDRCVLTIENGRMVFQDPARDVGGVDRLVGLLRRWESSSEDPRRTTSLERWSDGLVIAGSDPARELHLPAPPGGELAFRHVKGAFYRSLVLPSLDESRLWVGYDLEGETFLRELNLETYEVRELETPRGTISRLDLIGPDEFEFTWGAIGHEWTTLRLGETPPPGTEVRWEHGWIPWPDGPPGLDHIPAVLVYPDGEPPTGGWPMVVYGHGGPHIHRGNAPLIPKLERLRKSGAVCLIVNYPGSTGYGEKYRMAAFGRLVTTEAQSIVAATRWSIAERGINPGRIVGMGSSYAGMPLLVAASTAPDLFQGVSLEAPVVDPLFKWEHAPNPWERRLWERRMGGSPAEVPERWVAASPLTYAGGLTCPVDIICYDDDRSPAHQVRRYTDLRPDLVSVAVMPDSHDFQSRRLATTAAADDRRATFVLKLLSLQPRATGGIQREPWRYPGARVTRRPRR